MHPLESKLPHDFSLVFVGVQFKSEGERRSAWLLFVVVLLPDMQMLQGCTQRGGGGCQAAAPPTAQNQRLKNKDVVLTMTSKVLVDLPLS
jgi:hypothetical protein